MKTFVPDQKLIRWMQEIRRTIHQNPELGFQEHETARYIASKLDEIAIPYKQGVATTGIVATLSGNDGENHGIALRADMDALPVAEQTGLAFSSKKDGLMHACGHDGHVAMLLGAAAMLKKESPPGKVVFLFQPAEENEGGAQKMIDDGALSGVQAVFGGHIDRHYQVGEICVEPGQICAQTDKFSITIRGRGGHAAKPHETIDSIVVASLLVMSLQTLVSREVNPSYPTVVTVGRIQGGTAANVIADMAVLEGTIRTTHPEVRNQIVTGLTRMVKSMESLYNAETTIVVTEGYPPVINDTKATKTARRAAEKAVGRDGVLGLPFPSLGGEDFSFYLKHVPGCFVRFGAMKKAHENTPAHSPHFDFDEGVLPVGASFFAHVARGALLELSTQKNNG